MWRVFKIQRWSGAFDSIRFGSVRFGSIRSDSVRCSCIVLARNICDRFAKPTRYRCPTQSYFTLWFRKPQCPLRFSNLSSRLFYFLKQTPVFHRSSFFSILVVFRLFNISHLISEITKTQIFNQLIFHLPIKRNLSANELNREPVFVSFVNFLIYLLMKFLFSQFRPIPSYFALFAKLAFPLLVKFLQGATLFVASHVFWSKFNPPHRLASSGRFTTTKGGEREGGREEKTGHCL